MMRGLFVIVTVCLAVAACGDDERNNTPVDAAIDAEIDADPGPQPSVQRGSYLVNAVLLCSDCHTPRNPDGSPIVAEFLAGVPCFVDVNGPTTSGGCLNTRNLTNHATGLANRSDAEIRTMFQHGMRPNGDILQSFMPYWMYANLTEVDAASVVMYLRTVPGVDKTIPPNDAEWPAPTAVAATLDVSTIPATSTTNASIANGKYLATLSCVDCHTPHTNPADLRSLDPTKFFAGGNAFEIGGPFGTVVTRNLTPHATGLATYTASDIVRVLKMGVDPQGRGVCPPMPAGMAGFGNLTDQDAADLAAFVDALVPIANDTGTDCSFTLP